MKPLDILFAALRCASHDSAISQTEFHLAAKALMDVKGRYNAGHFPGSSGTKQIEAMDALEWLLSEEE